MSVREYIGARYVPMFAEPTAWDSTKTYEPLTIVLYQGNSYTSRQYVPAGIDIGNGTYWVQTGNYNAQIDAYRAEVQTFDGRITTNANDIASLDSRIDTLEETAYMLVIGDSFSNDAQSGTPLWYTRVARHYGLTAYTNASDGMGFTVGANNFDAQVETAHTALSGRKVERVYVLGGLNDTRNSGYDLDTTREAVRQLLDKIDSYWPNAKKCLCGPQSFPQINANNCQLADWMSWYAYQRGWEYIDFTARFMVYNGFYGGKTGTNPHPSASGEAIIASTIINHGRMATSAVWVEAFLPSSITPSTPQNASLFVAGGSGTIESDAITYQQMTMDAGSIVYQCSIDATKIPDTVSRLGLNLPYALGLADQNKLKSGARNSTPYMSQLYGNEMYSGWTDMSGAVQFNINEACAVHTGNGARAIRIHYAIPIR